MVQRRWCRAQSRAEVQVQEVQSFSTVYFGGNCDGAEGHSSEAMQRCRCECRGGADLVAQVQSMCRGARVVQSRLEEVLRWCGAEVQYGNTDADAEVQRCRGVARCRGVVEVERCRWSAEVAVVHQCRAEGGVQMSRCRPSTEQVLRFSRGDCEGAEQL